MAGLDEMIDAFRELSKLPERTAEIAAEKLDERTKATARAGETPSGKSWEAKKAGGRAMKNAAAHVSTKALGPVIRQTLTGPDVFHHFGKGKTEVRRQVIPIGGAGIPQEVAEVLDAASAQAFRESTGAK